MKSHCWQFDAYGAPGEVLVKREQVLAEPGPGQALVAIKSIGVNRADLNYVLGQYFPADTFPSCLGGEAVGEIIALGPPDDAAPALIDALELAVGTRVAMLSSRVDRTGMGVYRDVGLYDHATLAPVPDSYSNEMGAAFWTGLLTMGGAMEMGRLTRDTGAGMCVLVTAASSGMGVLGLKLARLWGAETIATTRSVEKSTRLGKLADHVVVCDDGDSLAAGVTALGKTVDLALDPLGEAYYPGLLAVAARGGHIVSYESITGKEIPVSILDLMLSDVGIHGYTSARPFANPMLLNSLVRTGLENAAALRPEVSEVFPFSDVPAALETLQVSQHVGKLVINIEA